MNTFLKNLYGGLATLVICLFVGIVIISIGLGALFPPINQIAAPIACAGGQLQLTANTTHPRPGETVTSMIWFCVDGATGVQRQASFLLVFGTAGSMYGLLLFVVPFLMAAASRSKEGSGASSFNPLGLIGGILAVLGAGALLWLVGAFAVVPALRSSARAAADADAALAARQAGLPAFFTDDFKTDNGLWSKGPEKSDLLDGTRSVSDGALRWSFTAYKSFGSFDYPAGVDPRSDIYASVEVRMTAPADGDAGLVLRRTSDDSQWYFFSLDGQGQYSFDLYSSGWKGLLPETASPAVKPGALNKLSAALNGSHFVLLINDQVVASLDDSAIARGQTGLGAELANPDDTGVFAFQNFEIRSAR